MALKDEVKARFSVQQLANLTNPQNSGISTIDDTRLDKAVADTQADIEIYAGVVYNNADARHVATAIIGVQEYLRMNTGQVSAADSHEKWQNRVRDLGRVTGRDRILPETNSTLVPSPEIGYPSRPYFDTPNFFALEPDPPASQTPYTSP